MDLIYEMDEVDEGGKIVKYEVQGTKEWLSVIGYRLSVKRGEFEQKATKIAKGDVGKKGKRPAGGQRYGGREEITSYELQNGYRLSVIGYQ